MTAAEPLRPDLARELIDRATKAAARRAKRLRNQLDAVQLGQDRHADHADAKVLRRVLAEHDWPGHRLVGTEAARAAWSLALHADDDAGLQRAATTLLERAVQDGDARVQHWAHLYDRTLLNSSRPQEFGTQQAFTATGVVLCPVRARLLGPAKGLRRTITDRHGPGDGASPARPGSPGRRLLDRRAGGGRMTQRAPPTPPTRRAHRSLHTKRTVAV